MTRTIRPTPHGPRALVAACLLVAAIAAGGLVAGAGAAPAPAPERGVAVMLEPVSGRVLVHPGGVTTYRRLRAAERMPVGTTVDAQEGAVRLTVARDGRGGTWTAVFSEGKFTITQPKHGEPVTTLKLTGPSVGDACAGASASGKRKRKKVRKLWGDGKGRFRTSGHYSAATVRGTRWLTEDRCDGTLTRVVRGTVEVEDFTAVPEPGPPPPAAPPDPDRTEPPAAPAPATGGEDGGGVVLQAGGSYVARPGH
jgi:hypothetical protein